MALDEANFTEEDYDNTINKTWNTSFEADGIIYATNLFWQPLQNVEEPIIDVEQAAENILEGADLYCIKKGKAPQFGICASKEGYKKGQYTAATAISSAMSSISSFVAVFKVDNGWWYICIRNDIILSDGDMLFTDEADAKAQFESMLAVPDWNKKIAPKEWGFENTEETSLEELLAGSIPARLQKIKSLKGGKLTAIIAVSGFVGLWILYSLIDAIFLTPPKRPTVSIAPKTIKPKGPAVVKEVAPWEKVANAEQIMTQCYDATKVLISIMPPGWNISDIKCSPTAASTNWKKNVGKVSWIKKSLEETEPKVSFSFTDSGSQANASIGYEKVDIQKNPPALSANELIFQLNDLFQSLGIKINLRRETIKPKPKQGTANKTTTQQKTYYMVGFNFESPQNPTTWIKILTKFSGLYIKNIQYNTTSKSWKYEGAIYVL